MNKFLLIFFLFFVSNMSAQQTDYVDFKKINAFVSFDSKGKRLAMKVRYEFDIIKDIDSVYIDARNTYHYEFKESNFKIYSKNLDGNKIVFYTPAERKFETGKNYYVEIIFFSFPKSALYFVDNQIWTQGQGKYTSNWLPSIDDVNDKIEFDLSISYDKDFEVTANGELSNVEASDSIKTWHFNMNKPMSSYLVALAIGNYNKKTEVSKSGIPLEYYYYPEDSLKVESTYRYSKQMFDYLEDEIDVPYPWDIYKQVPVKDFLYSGMENTTLTIFSDALMTDSIAFKDRNYVNVNAHELAHHWFGNLVTAKSGEHHWLQEGFATFYALLAERHIFGDDYYYWQLYEYAQELLEQEKLGQSTSILDPKSSSLTFYKKGCWALHILKEQIGEEAFKQAVKNYLTAYQFESAETSVFIQEVEKSSGIDLTEFVETWLKVVELPQDAMVKSLKKSEFIQEYLDVSCDTYPSKCNDYLVSDISGKAKVKILSQESYNVKEEDFKNSWEVRQAIAQNLTEIPLELKKSYESLLNDKSYTTIEVALYNLWMNFPEDRSRYLEKTKDLKGFSDYNVRMLWLALNLNTLEYQSEQKQQVFDELKNYTSANFGFEVRMNAFNFLKLINGFDEDSIKNLVDGTEHHNWRMQQFSKNLLDELSQIESYKKIIDKLTNKG
nr:M1 family metallopeptidase [Subsaxibacter sp. CAU 1640]